jgi:hypothetical protein
MTPRFLSISKTHKHNPRKAQKYYPNFASWRSLLIVPHNLQGADLEEKLRTSIRERRLFEEEPTR